MKWLRKGMIHLLPFAMGGAVLLAFSKEEKGGMLMCTQEYALCTSARCIPQPGDPSKSICFCDVEEGKSFGTLPCDQLKPVVGADGVRMLFSTFSLKQPLEGKKAMRCPAGTPWANCLNKRCTVDPSDPKKAICQCDTVVSDQEWTTFGGSCDTSSCKTAYWSAATVEVSEQNHSTVARQLGMKHSPVKWCQGGAL